MEKTEEEKGGTAEGQENNDSQNDADESNNNQQGDEEDQEDSSEDSSDDSEDSSSQQSNKSDQKQPDWKAVAQENEDAADKSNQALARYRKGDKNFKKKMKAGKEEEESEEDTETKEKPLTRDEFESILDRRDARIRKESLGSEVKKIARAMAKSDDEASAIVAIYNARSFPENLSLEEQVQEAHSIAHGPRYRAKIDEFRRALSGQDSAGSSGDENTHRDMPKGKEPSMSPQDRESLKRRGYKWTGKRFEKLVKSGPNKGKKMVVFKLGDSPVLE